MINFRFHLVSLIAVFLALALGVVVGSTVIDRAIVDGLEAQIDRVERNAEEQRRQNGELRQRLEHVEVFAEQVAPFAMDARLADVPVAVVAVRGVDEDVVASAVAGIRSAGAIAPAVLWLEPVWALPRQDDRARLRDVVELQAAAPTALRNRALALIAERLTVDAVEEAPVEDGAGDDGETATSTTTSTASSTTTTTTLGEDEAVPETDALEELTEAGFISVDMVGGEEFDLAAFPASPARVVVVGGPAGRVSTETLYVPLVQALADQDLPVVAAEVPASGNEEEAVVVGSIRSDDALSETVPTVDGLDTVRGRVALVVALAEVVEGTVGHYGTGPGASRQLPENPAG